MVGSNNLLFYGWWIIIVVITAPVYWTGNGSGQFQLVLVVIHGPKDLETVGGEAGLVSGFLTSDSLS